MRTAMVLAAAAFVMAGPALPAAEHSHRPQPSSPQPRRPREQQPDDERQRLAEERRQRRCAKRLAARDAGGWASTLGAP